MIKKQTERRPAEKPAERGPAKQDPTNPSGRVPETLQDRPLGKPEGHPLDKQVPPPGARSGGKDILDSERSDRDSGRPVQLEEGDERASFPPGLPKRGDSEHGRPQEGREGGKPYEAEKTQR
jgi:hypothetical protein